MYRKLSVFWGKKEEILSKKVMHNGTEMLVMRADITKVFEVWEKRENLPKNASYALKIT
jgi:hypothetical protein